MSSEELAKDAFQMIMELKLLDEQVYLAQLSSFREKKNADPHLAMENSIMEWNRKKKLSKMVSWQLKIIPHIR